MKLRNRSEFLSPSELEMVHSNSLRLLEDVGVEFHAEEALETFARHGLKTRDRTVTFSEKQVLDALATVPSQFSLRARNSRRNVSLGGAEPVLAPGYGAPFVMDPEAGRRKPTMQDYDDLMRLADALPHQDLSGHMLVQPADVPACAAHLHMILSAMVHSDKPFVGSTEGVAGARHTMEMAAILFEQDRTALGEQPVTLGIVNSLSPLHYGGEMAGALMEYAAWRQPVLVSALIMAGATGPITLAGVLAQQNAEILAGIVLSQLVSPGTPMVYGCISTIMDMRTGSLAIGSPELSILAVASAQMARYYGLPSRSGGALTDAHTVDAQAGWESMLGLLSAFHSGADFVLHAGGILSSFLAFSYEKFVVDDEICGLARRFWRGLEVTPGTLAYEVIAGVGARGNFLREPHTVERCRSEFWLPAITSREGWDSWLNAGQPDANQRARRRCQELLAEHKEPPLDAVTLRQLQAYVKKQGC